MPQPYEFLARWDDKTGAFKGSAIRWSDGSIQPIGNGAGGFPLADILGQLQVDALAAAESLTLANAGLVAERNALVAERDQAVAERDAAVAQAAQLQAQLDAIAAAQAQAAAAVESHKARIELIVRGEWAQILAIVEAMPEPQRSIANEALYAPHYRRDSPMIAMLADAMGWSAADVDERFAAATARVV